MINKSLPVVVKDLCKDAWVPVKEILVEDGIVVSERLCESRQTSGWDLLQGRFVRLVSDPPHVQDDPVLTVHRSTAGVRAVGPSVVAVSSGLCNTR